MKFKKVFALFSLSVFIALSQISSSFGISLVDKSINYTEYSGQLITESFSVEDLKENNNMLIKNSFDQKEVHLFDKYTNEYIGSYLIKRDKVYKIYLSDLEKEKEEYQKSGIKGFPTLHVSNVQNSDWFIDQGNTGEYSRNNCGPSSVAMVINWFNGNSLESAKQARDKVRLSGGWWYTNNVSNYLENKNLTINTNYVSSRNDLIRIIDKGNVAILCIDASKITYNSKSRVGRFYHDVTGHFLVLTGYIQVGGETYFEVYDPNTWNRTIDDKNIPMGKGRYFKSEELLKAMELWWSYAIEVNAKKLPTEEILDLTESAQAPLILNK